MTASSGFSVYFTADTAVIQFSQPDTFNGIAEDNIEVFPELVSKSENTAGIKYIVMVGAEGLFCSGGGTDFLKGLSEKPVEQRRETLGRSQRWVRALITSECLTIAAVDGLVAGAGFDLMLAFDAILFGPRARLNLWYTKLGVVPDLGGLHLLSQIIGWKPALEFYARSPTLDADAAAGLGLGRAESRLPDTHDGWPKFLKRNYPIDRSSFSAAKNLATADWLDAFYRHQEKVAAVQAELLGAKEFQDRLGRVATMQKMMRSAAARGNGED